MPSKRLPRRASIAILCSALVLCIGLGDFENGSPVVRAAAPDAGLSGYHLVKTIKLGGEGLWDYLEFDPAARHLFISRGTKVVVLDVDSEKVAAEIPDTTGVHGIALAPDLGKGFTSNGGAGTVTIFDLKTLQVLGTANVGMGPDAIVYDPATQRVFTMNGRGGDSTAIDAKSGQVVGTIPLDGRPESAVADGAGHVYVNIENKSEVAQIDSKNLTITARWPVAPGESPAGLAIDSANRRLFVGCHNRMMAILDADTGKVLATPAIGVGVDADRFDPGTGFAFASTGSGVLSVIHEDSPDKFTFVEDVPTQQGARTMALDTKTHQVFLVTGQFAPPPAPTPDNPHPRGGLVPDSFVVLVFAR
ncbi:MAG TPA: YncE family protein [Candidatus Aquilonibacter sp.]|nr:YncE family protein [Candidatus Aquilonibacter sp.]